MMAKVERVNELFYGFTIGDDGKLPQGGILHLYKGPNGLFKISVNENEENDCWAHYDIIVIVSNYILLTNELVTYAGIEADYPCFVYITYCTNGSIVLDTELSKKTNERGG